MVWFWIFLMHIASFRRLHNRKDWKLQEYLTCASLLTAEVFSTLRWIKSCIVIKEVCWTTYKFSKTWFFDGNIRLNWSEKMKKFWFSTWKQPVWTIEPKTVWNFDNVTRIFHIFEKTVNYFAKKVTCTVKLVRAKLRVDEAKSFDS